MIQIEATRAAALAGVAAVLRVLRLEIEAQYAQIQALLNFGEDEYKISGVMGLTVKDCNKRLAPLQDFAVAALDAMAVDERWPEEVEASMQFSLPLAAGGEIEADVLEHRWTGDLLARMDCGFDAATLERCINNARQRDRF